MMPNARGNKNKLNFAERRWVERARDLGFRTEIEMWFYIHVFEHWSTAAIADLFDLSSKEIVERRFKQVFKGSMPSRGGANRTAGKEKQYRIARNHPDFQRYFFLVDRL